MADAVVDGIFAIDVVIIFGLRVKTGCLLNVLLMEPDSSPPEPGALNRGLAGSVQSHSMLSCL